MEIYFEKLITNSLEFEIDLMKDADKKDAKYNIFTNDKKEHIGTIEGYILKNNDFFSVVRINPEFQGKGFGFEAFNKVFQELNAKNNITEIHGSWHKDEEFSDCIDGMSTNLKAFKEESKMKTNLSECAFITPTGKWAKKLGFNTCEILQNSDTTVKVVFKK